MKFPNGFGSITRKKGRLRAPFMVRRSVGGKQVFLGCFRTYKDALIFLTNINKDVSVIKDNRITLDEMYKLMAADRFPKIRESSVKNYVSVYKYCEKIKDKEFIKLRLPDLQNVINEIRASGAGYATQKKMRQLFHNIYHYGIKYEFTNTDYSRFIEIDVKEPSKRKPFNKRQLNRVKGLIDDNSALSPWAKCVWMMVYSGVRPSEFLAIKKCDVKLYQRFFVVRESKTKAGENRIVPISKIVLPYFEDFMKVEGEYLVQENGHRVTYARFKTLFTRVMSAARCKHSPHECRHTLATMLDNAGANEVATRKILGHSIPGITKGVYTHKNLHELKKAIDKLR